MRGDGVLATKNNILSGSNKLLKPVILKRGTKSDIKDFASSRTILRDELGKIYTNSGATGAIEFTLPSAALVVGESVQFFVMAAQDLEVTPASGEAILGLAADASLTANAIGESLGLTATADGWMITVREGTWA